MAKGASRRRPPKKPRPERLSIFISYAREDGDLAASVHAELLQLFSFTPVEIFRDVGIPLAANYQTTIDQQLDGADILLVLITDRMKPSYSYTGYEVGFFRRSILNRPKIFGDIDRVIIPVCIGADSPDALHYVQSIQIDPDKVFKIAAVDTAEEGDQNPATTLLNSIAGIVLDILGIQPSAAINARLMNSASRLYGVFRGYLQGRVSSETFPERKIIIRSDAPPALLADGADLTATKIELVGASFQVFGFPEEGNREFTWAEFNAKMPSDMSGTWAEGIKALVAGTLHNSAENYHVVSTTKGDEAFRLFVSKIVTYVSKRTEIHIYIVKMVLRHYGDRLTSRLLSAVSIGLQFRFLFLEDSSKFRPARFDFPMAIDVAKEVDAWKSTITELMSQMDLILREAQDQHLMDTDLLDRIWGSDAGPRVQQMMGKWDIARAKLYSAAQQLLASSASDFVSGKEPFKIALRELCAETDNMNREYTLRALRSISEEIGGKLNVSDRVRGSPDRNPGADVASPGFAGDASSKNG
jgi:hypothetical protein